MAGEIYVNYIFLNKEAAADREFTTVMAFSDPGVGAWTIHVADGAASVSQGEANTSVSRRKQSHCPPVH